ncbi:propanol-preferring alcohol dehydrogenase [Halopolyspora algeriensis]|uniref:alcohol dehydrogenase n=1 Tax=Halopolyspora algeriensis TaxID=1500506 RepID=A0A368VY48_9ACTN|nr:NAD(P)-dependent alcohol dehydrogenase [Halopolyspora algeriensis]RCW47118.1 propanol-preferring alcohol dehydrogenase [Halopolyspora algeriensis]TQM48205.1 propanol-preferring alcohol dehydrogenase [Halopolyspora algeriensis]
MRAVQYHTVGQPPEVRRIPEPEPGPGQVLLEVTAAGLCHSDVAVMNWTAEEFPYPLPLTLGHEGAGRVAALGSGVDQFSVGDSVLVYGPWGCGQCHYCARGKENYCPHAAERAIRPPGLGAPGALADYLLVDSPRHLVSIGDLDPVRTVPFTDAGLTPYHAIKKSLPKLVPGSTAVVIGAGGLGHIAIQLLHVLSPARVVALDISEDKLALAREVGADEVLLSDEHAVGKVRDLTAGRGAELVLDLVGSDVTGRTAAGCAGVESDLTIIGIGGGSLAVGFGLVPFACSVSAPYWGGRDELIELVSLVEQGAVHSKVEVYGLEEVPDAYSGLESGTIDGRAVAVPSGGPPT